MFGLRHRYDIVLYRHPTECGVDDRRGHVDGLVEDYNISSALARDILQSYTKPSIYDWKQQTMHKRHLTYTNDAAKTL